MNLFKELFNFSLGIVIGVSLIAFIGTVSILIFR